MTERSSSILDDLIHGKSIVKSIFNLELLIFLHKKTLEQGLEDILKRPREPNPDSVFKQLKAKDEGLV